MSRTPQPSTTCKAAAAAAAAATPPQCHTEKLAEGAAPEALLAVELVGGEGVPEGGGEAAVDEGGGLAPRTAGAPRSPSVQLARLPFAGCLLPAKEAAHVAPDGGSALGAVAGSCPLLPHGHLWAGRGGAGEAGQQRPQELKGGQRRTKRWVLLRALAEAGVVNASG